MLTRLKTALKLLPDEPSAHLGRARALAVPGRNAEAAQRGIDQNLDTYKLAEKAQNSFRRRRASAADSVGWAYFTKKDLGQAEAKLPDAEQLARGQDAANFPRCSGK